MTLANGSFSLLADTPGRFAVQQLYQKLITTSEGIIDYIRDLSLEHDLLLSKLLELGANEFLDQLITAFGRIGKHCAASALELLIDWRSRYQREVDIEIVKSRSARADSSYKFSLKEIQFILSERVAMSSDFIFCRIAIELIKQLKPDSATQPIYARIEEIAFDVVKTGEPEQLQKSKNKQKIHDLFAELLGTLSGLRFTSVADRFLEEIGVLKETKIERTEMLIKAMRFLILKIYPMGKLEESADFLQTCGQHFQETHNQKIKHSFADLFAELLAPISAVAEAEVNVPSWVKSIDGIYRKAIRMSTKPYHVMLAYPLVTNLLCVSRKDFFLSNWYSFMEQCWRQFRQERPMRAIALQCICRLLWVYLFRWKEQDSKAMTSIEALNHILFPQGKRWILPAETPLECFTHIVHFVSMRNLDYGMNKMILILLGAESLGLSATSDSLCPDRIIIAIKAFLLIAGNLEQNERRPPFPHRYNALPSGGSVRSRKTALSMAMPETDVNKAGLVTYLAVVNNALGHILNLIDSAIGSVNQRNDKMVGKTLSDAIPKEKMPLLDVAKAIFDAMPRCMPTADLDETRLYTIIANFSLHMDPAVAQDATQAIQRIAEQCPERRVTLLLALGAFCISLPDRLPSLQQQSLQLYITCFKCLTPMDIYGVPETANGPTVIDDAERVGLLLCCNINAAVRVLALQVLRVAGDIGSKAQAYMLTAKAASLVHNGLSSSIASVNLLSSMPETATSGSMNSKAAKKGHRASDLKALTQRVIHVMDETGPDAINLIVPAVRSEEGSSDTISVQPVQSFEQLAESDSPDHQLLWIRVFSEMLKSVFELCPNSVKRCWPDVTARLLELHPSIETSIAPSSGSLRVSIVGMPVFSAKFEQTSDDKIAQWRNYLQFACCTAFTPETPSGSSKTKTTIQSARDLFRLILPLLKSDRDNIVNAVVGALGVTSWVVYKVLLEELQPTVKNIYSEENRVRSRQPNRKVDGLRVEITRIYHLTADFFRHKAFTEDDALMQIVLDYTNLTKSFLTTSGLQLSDVSTMRYDFCGFIEKVYDNVCRNETLCARYFPPTLRASLFYMFEEWSGFSVSLVSVLKEEPRPLASSPSKDLTKRKDSVRESREIREHTEVQEPVSRSKLEFAAVKAMAVLCKGRLILRDKRLNRATEVAEDTVFNFANLFEWINTLFQRNDKSYHVVARSALESLLFYNSKESFLLDTVINACYAGPSESAATRGYFLALVDVFTRQQGYPCHLPTILNLILYKTADPDQHIRKSAVQLLQLIEERFFLASLVADYRISITSSLPTTYKQSQEILSARLAQDHPALTIELLAEMTRRVETVLRVRQRDMLAIALPWLANLQFSNSPASRAILTNLFFLTVKFGDEYAKEIELLWIKLTEREDNVAHVISFLLKTGLSIRSPEFTSHAKKVIVYMGRTKACKLVVNVLVDYITPDYSLSEVVAAAINPTSNRETPDSKGTIYTANLQAVLPQPTSDANKQTNEEKAVANNMIIAKGELAFILLVDLTLEISEELRPHLPRLLHVAFMNLDHFSDIVYEQSRLLFINLIHSLAAKHAVKPEDHSRATQLISILSAKEGKRMWAHEERSMTGKRLPSEADMSALLQKALDVFAVETPDLRQRWANISLVWATSCPFQHLANRSVQVFRLLKPVLQQQMLADLLTRLSDTLASARADARSLALEILLTLEWFIDSLDHSKLILFPQLFWAAVAILSSNYDYEFLRGTNMLLKLLERLDVSEESVRSVLLSHLPLDWQPPFLGIQSLILKGLVSEVTEPLTVRFLSKLCTIKADAFIDPSESRLLFTILASLPYLCSVVIDEKDANHPSLVYAGNIAQLCDYKSQPNLSKWFKSFNKKRKVDEESIRQLMTVIKDSYFPNYEVATLQFLLELVDHGPAAYKRPVLLILRSTITLVGLSSTQQVKVDHADLIGPLFRLLNTDFSEEASLILDHTVSIAAASKAQATSGDTAGDTRDLWTGKKPWWVVPEGSQSIARRKITNVRAMCFGVRSIKRHSKLFTDEEIRDLFSSPEKLSSILMPLQMGDQESPRLLRSTSFDPNSDVRLINSLLTGSEMLPLPALTLDLAPSHERSNSSSILTPISPNPFGPNPFGSSNLFGSNQLGGSTLSLFNKDLSPSPSSSALPLKSDSSEGLVPLMNRRDTSMSIDNNGKNSVNGNRNTLRRSKSAPPAMRAMSKWFMDLLSEPLTSIVLHVQYMNPFSEMMRNEQHLEQQLIDEFATALNMPKDRVLLIAVEGTPIDSIINAEYQPQLIVTQATGETTPRIEHIAPSNQCTVTFIILPSQTGSSIDILVATEELISNRSDGTVPPDKNKCHMDPTVSPAVFVATPERLYPYLIAGQTVEPVPPNDIVMLADTKSTTSAELKNLHVVWTVTCETWFRWFDSIKRHDAEIPVEFRDRQDSALRAVAADRITVGLFTEIYRLLLLLRDDFKTSLETRLASLSAKAIIVQNTIAHLLKLLATLSDNVFVPSFAHLDQEALDEVALKISNIKTASKTWATTFQTQQIVIGEAISLQLRTYMLERLHTQALVMSDDSDHQTRKVSVSLCNQATHYVRLLQYAVSFWSLMEDILNASEAKRQAQYNGTVRSSVSIATYVSTLLSSDVF